MRPYIKPKDVFEIWAAEFDKAYEERTLFVLTMHPKIIGHRSRIVILDKLIKHIQKHKDVWLATPLVIDVPALASNQNMNPFIAVPNTCYCDHTDSPQYLTEVIRLLLAPRDRFPGGA